MSNTPTLLDYARIGAAARLTEIQTEIDAIQNAFPELEGPVAERRNGRPRAQTAAPEPHTETPAPVAIKRKRRKMSAAARKAISEAQKRRWAAQKAVAA